MFTGYCYWLVGEGGGRAVGLGAVKDHLGHYLSKDDFNLLSEIKQSLLVCLGRQPLHWAAAVVVLVLVDSASQCIARVVDVIILKNEEK